MKDPIDLGHQTCIALSYEISLKTRSVTSKTDVLYNVYERNDALLLEHITYFPSDFFELVNYFSIKIPFALFQGH